MNIITKYNLGDYIHTVSERREKIRIATNCQVCNDSGKITLQDKDKSYTCPECRGNTYHINEGDVEYYVSDRSGEIGNVRAEIYDKKYKREETRIIYMLDSTGVGSGTLWYEEDLFLTDADAKAECVTRNLGRYESKSKWFIKKKDRAIRE